MDTNLCIVCDDYNENENENENYNIKKFKINYLQKEDIENVPNYSEQEEDLKFDILLDNQQIKKNLKNINEEEMIYYLQKYHDFNFFKKYHINTFNKINTLVEGISYFKL
jgi:hypothetical protein